MHKLTMDFLQEQYRKTKLLRSSSKGEVWLVTQADDTPAVMHIINHLGVPGNLLRDNPHTLWPRILYFAEDEAQQRTIIVEEYIGGQSMQEYLQNGGNLSEAEAQKFLLDFCYGLSHLHKLGIVHRDIKPSNIIRQSSGGFKLIDFDVARLRNTKVEDKDTVLLGTRGYAPPEQYGYSQTDRRSDIYSLGVTVDELLGEEYKGYLRPVIRKCRALDPAMRYQSAEEVIRAIKIRRGFKIAMPVVVAILLLMALTVIWLISGSQTPDSVGNPIKQLEELIELPSLPDSPENVESPQMLNHQNQTESPRSSEGLPSNNTDNDTVKVGKEFQGNGISMETVGHGNGLSGGTAGVYYVYPDVYRYWSRENQDKLTGGYSVYLPDDWYIDVVIKNSEWNGPWSHPTFDITYTRSDWDGNNIVSREVREMSDIPPGGSETLRINLGGMKIDNVRNYYGPKIHIQPRWPKNTKSGGRAEQIELDFLSDKG